MSDDVWMVLAEIDRAFAALAANPYDQGLQLTDASERVLSGLLALAGISGENMVRDAGWYMLDIGRGLERALQVVALLRATLGQTREPADRSDDHRGGADGGRVHRHLPPAQPRPERHRGADRPAGAGSAQSAVGLPTSCCGSGPTCGPSPTPRRPPGRSGCCDSRRARRSAGPTLGRPSGGARLDDGRPGRPDRSSWTSLQTAADPVRRRPGPVLTPLPPPQRMFAHRRGRVAGSRWSSAHDHATGSSTAPPTTTTRR